MMNVGVPSAAPGATGGAAAVAGSAGAASGAAARSSGTLRTEVMAWAQGMKEEDLQAQHDALAVLYDQLKAPDSALHQLESALKFSYEVFDLDDKAAKARLDALAHGLPVSDIKKKEKEFADLHQPLRAFRKQLSEALGVTTNGASAAAAAAAAGVASLTLGPTGGAGTAASAAVALGGRPTGPVRPFTATDKGVMTGHTEEVWPICRLPGTCIATSGSDKTIRIWDTSSLSCTRSMTGHTAYVYSLLLLPGGNTLASGSDDNSIKLWNWRTGECTKTLSGHTSRVLGLTMLPDGRLASCANDGSVKIWNLDLGACVDTVRATGELKCITTLHDGRLAVGTGGGKVLIIDPTTYSVVRTIDVFGGSTCRYAVVLHNGHLATAGENNEIKIWNIGVGSEALVHKLTGHTGSVWRLAVMEDSRLASCSSDGTVRIWDTATGACVHTLTQTNKRTLYGVVALENNGVAAGGSSDSSISGYPIRVWM